MPLPVPFRRAALAAALLPTLAQAQTGNIVAADPQAVLAAMQDFGFVATIETDNEGDPKIVSRISKTRFGVFFYGCTGNVDCASVQFYAGYDIDGTMSALKANEWNRDRLFTKATIDDEGDPAIEMDANLDDDGIGPRNFADLLDIWRRSVEDFEAFIGW